jgi:two-component system, response regulator
MALKDILLIEDEKVQAELVVRYLQGHRIANPVRVLQDGQQALDHILNLAEIDYPALILLDLNLPNLSGLEILRHLREYEKTRKLKVVILTASDDPLQESESLSLDVVSYLRKPINFEDLANVLLKLGFSWQFISDTE